MDFCILKLVKLLIKSPQKCPWRICRQRYDRDRRPCQSAIDPFCQSLSWLQMCYFFVFESKLDRWRSSVSLSASLFCCRWLSAHEWVPDGQSQTVLVPLRQQGREPIWPERGARHKGWVQGQLCRGVWLSLQGQRQPALALRIRHGLTATMITKQTPFNVCLDFEVAPYYCSVLTAAWADSLTL